MAANMNELAARAQALEQNISELADKKAPGVQLAALLQQYRDTCELIISADFKLASAKGIEAQLWNAHGKANAAFRSQLKYARRDAKERPVEFRKLKKEYLGFIKTSQRFYRQHILRLDAQFGGIQELRKVAEKWKEDASRIVAPKRIPASLRDQVFQSCHQTLIQLGDLSRYRAMELDEKERNWGPAKGYYDLAAEIDSNDGQSYNQLAVMAREDNDYFRLIYYLYRSLACKIPHKLAKQNLELAFKKIINAWAKGESISPKTKDSNISGSGLVLWFCRLHAKCYKGEEFGIHDELENEFLSNLAVDLKERPLDPILQKIILTNIAAEYFTTVQLQAPNPPENAIRTYFFYLRLNIKTFFTLLQVLQPELDRLSEGEDVTRNGDHAPKLSDKVTAVARRVLPGLRLYSTWFSCYWQVLDANIGEANTLTTVEKQELWKSYAATLTLLASSFPVTELPGDDYLLEEDIETFGFQPLVRNHTKRWYTDSGAKKKFPDQNRSHPNVEMLMRVRDLLVDGLALTQKSENVPNPPLDLDGLRFIYREAGLPSELLASPNNRPDGSPALAAEPLDVPLFPQEAPIQDSKAPSIAAASETGSTTTIAKDKAMNRMVDDLVGPDGLDVLPEEEENLPPTPPAQTFEDPAMVNDVNYSLGTFTINDIVKSVQNYKPSSSPRPPGTPLLSMPMHRVASSSSYRQPATLPSLPDGHNNGSSIWNCNSPASPLLSTGLEVRGSPLNGTSAQFGHSRGDSSNSIHSNDWNNYPVSGTPIQRHSGGLGNGASWGNPSSSPYTGAYGSNDYNSYNQYPQANYVDANLGSPALFGKNSSWNADLRNSSFYRTPPNGQGG